MNTKTIVAAAAVAAALAACGDSAPKAQADARERLETQYILAFKDEPGAKKCLAPKQLDGQRWFTLCGFNEGGPALRNGGLWELREESGSWAAYASNGRAAAAQPKLLDSQIKPPETPPSFDVGKARSLFPE